MSKNIKHEIRTAIIVDGGFYRQRARYLFWILWELAVYGAQRSSFRFRTAAFR